MTKADQLVDKAAARLQELADKAAAEGGVKAKLAQPLADDAQFLRKLKPSLIKARLQGRAPTDQKPGPPPPVPSGPQLGPRPRDKQGLNPLLLVAGAMAGGILIAKIVDWRSHAHPRD